MEDLRRMSLIGNLFRFVADTTTDPNGRTNNLVGFGRWAMLAVTVVALHGCSFAPRATRIQAVDSMPLVFSGAVMDSLPPVPRWWQGFGDPVLNALVDTALARNFDLAIAAARVSEIQNLYRISRSSLLPSLQLTVDGTRQEVPTNTGATRNISENIPDFPERFGFTTYSASLGLGYELDFWGRVRGSRNAALSNFFATREDMRTARLGVISETIATYFEVVEQSRQVALSRENVDLLSERAELTRDRYQRGLVTSFELYAIEQEFEDARAGLPLIEGRLFDAQGRLAILLGTYRKEAATLIGEGARQRSVDLDRIPAGLPSELLRNRPDVAAAAYRLEAARLRVGVARAEQFPRFSLTGSAGTQSSSLSDIVDTSQRFWLFGGSLTAPLFNAGALRANVKVAWAQYEQQAAAYEKTVLTAFHDVESSIVLLQKEGERYRFLSEALVQAEASARNQQSRYVRGIGDYLAYVDSRRNLIRVEATLATAERSLAGARLAVNRALGGDWVEISDDDL
jgi:NodT family efflux transporter outer membrane factor (OMF) lipoprotein